MFKEVARTTASFAEEIKMCEGVGTLQEWKASLSQSGVNAGCCILLPLLQNFHAIPI